MTLAIQTRDLTKRYPKLNRLAGVPLPFTSSSGGVLAVDRVSLDVDQGEVFGLVGPNGAGKTTLVKLLTTLILPTSGMAQVAGYPLGSRHEHRIKTAIGLVTGNERSFYPRLSCRENLGFYAGLHNLSPRETEQRIDELSDLLGMDSFLSKRYDTCSTGMKHRLALARGLINSPQLLFLDEPTRSLDPLAARRFRQALTDLACRQGRAVFLVTHDLDEAAELCDRIGVMVQGQVRVVDAPSRLPQVLRPRRTCHLQIRDLTSDLHNAVAGLDDVEGLSVRGGAAGTGDSTTVTVHLRDGRRSLPTVMHVIGECGGVVEELTFADVSWEEVFESLEDGLAVKTHPDSSRVSPAESASTPRRIAQLTPPTRRTCFHVVRQALSKPLVFFRRDLKTQMRYRLSFVLQFLGIFFSSASFYFVAQLLGTNSPPQLDRYGGDYFSFVLIGIAFVGYQGVALHAFSSVIRSAQSLGTLEAMLVTPTRLSTTLLSSSVWSFAFTSLRVVAYLLTGTLVFGANLTQANVLAGLVILLLTILTLSSIGILSACFIMVFKRGSPINFFIGSLSSLLGGVYYPLEVLPTWLRTLAQFFPLTYSLEAMRRALLRGETLVTLGREVATLTAFALVLLPIGLVAFRYAVQQAKRDGSLTHF